MRITAWWAGLSSSLLAVLPLQAQTIDAAIVGIVTAAPGTAAPARAGRGAPLGDATVEVRNVATGFHLVVTTDASGRFALYQLPLGGPYQLTVRRIGFRPVVEEGLVLALGARVARAFELEPAVAELAALEVHAPAGDERSQRLGANVRIDAGQLASLPAANRSFTDLAQLAPGTGAQLALAGQRWTATDFRLDGAQARNGLRAGEYGAGPYTVSMEAIDQFEVNTNVYDVRQGRGGGGAISAATKAGTNTWTGSAFSSYRSVGLTAATDYLGRSRDVRDFRILQWGGSAGGPLVRDRLKLFVAFDRQDAQQPLFTGAIATPQDAIANGIAADSLTRVLSILTSTYGLNAGTPQVGRLDASPIANTVLARLDWEISDRQRLTLRHSYSDWNSPLSGGVDQPITLYEARSNFTSREQQLLATLRSQLSSSSQNELRAGLNWSNRTLAPVSTLPRGFVRVRSTLPDGSSGDVRIQFGGNRLAPDVSTETQFQLIDHLFVRRGDVTWTLGMDHSLTGLSTLVAEAQGGLFEFDNLTQLANRTPFRYSRTVPLTGVSPTTQQTVLELGAFLQAEWRPSRRVTLSGGLRWDGTAFLTRPAYNPLVDSALGLRTDRTASDLGQWQPRAQLLWDVDDGRTLVRIGGGAFSSQAPYYVWHNELLNTGLTLGDVTRTANVPTPDYPTYRNDPSQIPGLAAGAPAPPPYVNTVSPDFQVPRTWKGNASIERRVTGWFTLTGTVTASQTTSNFAYIAKSLRTQPAFTLANEGNRPVFVPASTITAAGATNVANALQVTAVGRTYELQSIAEANQRSLIVEAALHPTRESTLQASWTWGSARDNSSFSCCLARTAIQFTPVPGDPRDLSGSWGPSDFDVRHKVVVYGSLPPVWGIRLSGRYVGQTGRPFSFVVNGDINGDEGTANDLAFVFDPANPSTPASVAASMAKVLANPNNVGAACLAANLGRVAPRNCATAPWNERVDVRLSKSINLGHGQRVELTLDCFNVMNLLNGSWGGQYLLPAGISVQNPVNQRIPLLNVVGFNQATRTYTYTVNENAGVLQLQGDPYTLQLGVRYGL